MLKAVSITGFLGMAGGIIALVATGKLFSPSPWVIATQAAALTLLLWARLTFGRRSFHARRDMSVEQFFDRRAKPRAA